MEPEDLIDFRKRFGLTQTAAARLVGVTQKAWEKWESRERKCVGAAPRLIMAMDRFPKSIPKFLEQVA